MFYFLHISARWAELCWSWDFPWWGEKAVLLPWDKIWVAAGFRRTEDKFQRVWVPCCKARPPAEQDQVAPRLVASLVTLAAWETGRGREWQKAGRLPAWQLGCKGGSRRAQKLKESVWSRGVRQAVGGGKSPGCLRAEWVGSLLSFPKGWGKIFQVKSKFSGAVIYYFRTLFSTKLIQNCILVEKLCSASCMFWQFENELCVFTRKLWEGVDIHWKCFSFIHPFDLFIFPAQLTSICVFVPSEMQIWAFWDWVHSLLCLMQWDLDPESLIVEQYHLWQYFR